MIDNMLWVSGFIAHVALLCVLIRRSSFTRFPVFTLLIGYQIVRTITLALISRHGSYFDYYDCYWSLVVVDYFLQICLILEIARHVLRSNDAWIPGTRSVVIIYALLGTGIGVLSCAALNTPLVDKPDLWDSRATLLTSILTCALFTAVSLSANRLHLLWQGYVMAIGKGLAIWAVVALMGDVVRLHAGWHHGFVISDQVRMCTYIAVLLYWIKTFWFPERESPAYPHDMPAPLLALFGKG